MKERLTKRNKDGNAVAFNYIKTAGEFKEIVDRLADYEDLEEQGLIVRLPCKVGDTVYVPYNFKDEYGIATVKIEEIKIYDNKNHFMFFIEMGSDEEEFNQMFGDWKIGKSIGTSVFLTRTEAERILTEKIVANSQQQAINIFRKINKTAEILAITKKEERDGGE